MAAPTVAVNCTASDQNGNPVAGARYRAKLDQTEIYLGFVVSEVIEGVADANGLCVLRLWPNVLGVAGSLYQITATNPDTGKKFLNVTVSVPNNNCSLHQILVQAPYPTVDASQQALLSAQGALAAVTAQIFLADDDRIAAETAAAQALTRSAAAALSQYSAGLSAAAVTAAITNNTSAAGLSASLVASSGAGLVGFTNSRGGVGTVAGLAVKQSMRNNPSISLDGEAAGLRVGVCQGDEPGWLVNPAAGDFVAIAPYITSANGRNRAWAFNPIVDVPAGSPATVWCMEGNVNMGTANASEPRVIGHALGIDMVSGGGFAPSAAFLTSSTSLANRWKYGLWFDNVGGQPGSALIKTNFNVDVDFGIDLGSAVINKQALRIGATPLALACAIGVRQFSNAAVGIFLQRNTDTAPTGNMLQVVNAVNSVVLASIDVLGNIKGSSFNGPLVTNGTSPLAIGEPASDIQWRRPLVALGGGVAPTLGTIGGSGPAVAAQNTWIRFLDSNGAPFYLPVWK